MVTNASGVHFMMPKAKIPVSVCETVESQANKNVDNASCQDTLGEDSLSSVIIEILGDGPTD